jgi:hypothetical protein
MGATDEIRRSAPPGSAPGGEARLLCTAIKRQCSSALVGIGAGFFESIRLQAHDAWLVSPHATGAQLDREAATALAQRSARFVQDWRTRLETAFDDWLLASPAPADARPALSLVSESQLQLQLAVQAMATAADARLERVLEPLEGRFSQLALAASGARRGAVPVRPLHVAQTFIAGFQGEDVSEGLRTLLMHEFETRLLPVLTGLYAELDRQLAQAGYVPQRVAEARAAAVPAPAPAPAAAPRAAPAADAAWVPDGGMVERRVAGMPTTDRASAASGAPAASAMPAGGAMPDGVTASGSDGLRAGPGAGTASGATAQDRGPRGPGGSSAGAAAAAAADGVPMRYRDIVHDHLRHWRQNSAQPAANDAIDAQTSLGSQALHTVASLLQGDDASRFAQVMAREGGRPLSAAIRDAVASGARQLGLASGALQFAPDQEDAIDLVAMLFEALMHTRSAATAQGDAVPRLYAQLVMPYLKIALLDDSLFNRRTHPARQLLDAITEVCDDAPEREGVALVEGVVDRIVTGYREDLAIFELAVDELRQFQQQQRHRSELAERRAAEALYGRERLVHARAWTRAQLLAWSRRHLDTTEAVAGFLRGPWRHAHEQACLRHSEDPARAEELVQLGESLLRLDADARRVDGPSVASAWLGMADAVDTCCQRAGMGEAARLDLVAALVFSLAHPETGRSVHPLAPDADATNDPDADAQPALRLAGGTDAIRHDPALAARMRRLRPGQGLRIIDDNGHESPARVAWISPLTSRLLVVNKRGQRLLVASPEELATLLDAGRIALAASEAPFDRAMKRLWQQLNAASGESVALAG